MTRMPRDQHDNPIPALTPKVAQKLATAGAAAVLSVPFEDGTEVIAIYCRNAALRYQLGDAGAEANAGSHFIDVGERLTFAVGSRETGGLHTHISIIRDGATDGTLEISEME